MESIASDAGLRGKMAGEANLPRVTLHEPPKAKTCAQSHEIGVVASMLFPYASTTFSEIVSRVAKMPESERLRLIRSYVGERKTRRDRPGRAFEYGYPLTFELVTDWCTYKDLMRHRMNTQLRQEWTPRIGFYLAPEISEAGLEGDVRACAEKAGELYENIYAKDPVLAQYAVLHGNYVRWMLGMNDREAFHMLELRTVPQGHPTYRKIAQEMHRCILVQSPWRAKAMKFVDYNDYYWSRADSEANQRAKERKLEERTVVKQ